MRLSQVIKKYAALRVAVPSIAVQSINENADVAADLVAGQLAKGIKSDGSPASFTYTPFTIALKRQRTGLAGVTSHLTNFDTGESYQKLFIKADGNQIEYGTKSDKEEAISERMEGEAFKLTSDSKIELKPYTQRTLNKKVRQVLSK